MLDRAREVGAEREVATASHLLRQNPAVPCAPRLASLFARAVEDLGFPAERLASGGGHDAAAMADLTDVAILFVRCKDGISHNPAESVTTEDVAVAVDVLSRFLELLAEQQLNAAVVAG